MSNYKGFYMNINTNAFSKLGGSKANKYSRTKTKQRKDAGEEMILPAELFGNDKADSVHMDLVVRSIFIEGTNYMAILDTPYGTVKANFNDIIAYDMKQQLKKPNQLLKEIERLIGKIKDKQTEALKRERKESKQKDVEIEGLRKRVAREQKGRQDAEQKCRDVEFEKVKQQMEYEGQLNEKYEECENLNKECTSLREENTMLGFALTNSQKAIERLEAKYSDDNIRQYGELIKQGFDHEVAALVAGLMPKSL